MVCGWANPLQPLPQGLVFTFDLDFDFDPYPDPDPDPELDKSLKNLMRFIIPTLCNDSKCSLGGNIPVSLLPRRIGRNCVE